MILNSKKKTSARMTRICLVFSLLSTGRSANAEEHNFNNLEWSNARGFVQHLHSLQSMPVSWTPALDISEDTRLRGTIDQCLRIANPDYDQFESCSFLFKFVAPGVSDKNNQKAEEIKSRFRVYTALAENSETSYSWSAWLRAASVFVLLGETEQAGRMIEKARISLGKGIDSADWKFARIELFERGLRALKSSKAGKNGPAKSQFPMAGDPQTTYISSSIDAIVLKMHPGKQGVEKGSEQAIAESRRQRWILRQDRDEIEDLRLKVQQSNISLDLLRRIESICQQHQVDSREWQTALGAILSVSQKTELLMRSDGIRLVLDSWLGREDRLEQLLAFDDDPLLARNDSILMELVASVERLISQMAEQLSAEEDKKVLQLVSERFVGMQSKLGRGLHRLGAGESTRRSLLMKRNLATIEGALRTLNARSAAVDLIRNDASPGLDYQAEIAALSREKRQLLMDFVSASMNLVPHTTTQHSSLKERIFRVGKALDNVQKVLAGLSKPSFQSTQAGLYFQESARLLERLKFESDEVFSRKLAEARKLAKAFAEVNASSSSIRSDLDQFMKTTGKLIRPQLLKLLGSVDVELYKQERSLELAEQIANEEIRIRTLKEKSAAEWTRDRINDARRIRSENLEWRSGR